MLMSKWRTELDGEALTPQQLLFTSVGMFLVYMLFCSVFVFTFYLCILEDEEYQNMYISDNDDSVVSRNPTTLLGLYVTSPRTPDGVFKEHMLWFYLKVKDAVMGIVDTAKETEFDLVVRKNIDTLKAVVCF